MRETRGTICGLLVAALVLCLTSERATAFYCYPDYCQNLVSVSLLSSSQLTPSLASSAISHTGYSSRGPPLLALPLDRSTMSRFPHGNRFFFYSPLFAFPHRSWFLLKWLSDLASRALSLRYLRVKGYTYRVNEGIVYMNDVADIDSTKLLLIHVCVDCAQIEW
jgi:hypothetical protein